MKNWICTHDFAHVKPRNVYKKELAILPPSEIAIQNYHVLFRKTFFLDEVSDVTYRIHITGDDYYKLYINGQFVGQGPAGAYHFVYNYNTYEVNRFLQKGENVISVHTYYHGLVDYAHSSGDLRQGMWAELYEGDQILLHTDESWKYCLDKRFDANGVTLGYDTQFAENIDNRLYHFGWKRSGFDDSRWLNAAEKQEDDHRLAAQITPSVEIQSIQPVKTMRFGVGHFLLDFGKEVVGTVRLKTKGERGSRVRIMCAEELTDEGYARYNMRCNVCYDESWILSGREDDIENFEYKGFRYIEVETEDEQVLPEQFSVTAQQYPIQRKRVFHSDNKLLNQIWQICENAVVISTQEGFYDCPTREKSQYLGDLLITALAHFYISGDSRPYKKALLDFANTQSICDGMMAVAPGSFMQEIADYSLLYPLILLNYYRITDDADFLSQMLPSAERVLHYFSKYKRPDGLLEGVTDKWNLVDWPESLRDGYEFKLTKPVGEGVHNVMNAYYYGAMKTVNEIRAILKSNPLYDVDIFKKAFYAAFYNRETKLFTDCEHGHHSALHSNVLPYFYEMTGEEENMVLPDFIMQKGFSCGVLFSYFVLKSLTKHKEHDKAMRLLLNRSENSWYHMLEEGATACFEAWGKEQKDNTSLCHPWAGAPIIILTEDFSNIGK